ncbi:MULTISPECIES: ChrR family anti-sigma-E factor [unclassified Rhizobium]|uniref:ChrR family anti-sigma-E factor n=1 Tax=unclassified Rhizobium TaxID=2613769 RepID=UPI0011992E4D|nr:MULTISPECIES: ChrR family anti-sigma-E factor [unclassified Rhizobium]MCZ3378248.1 cupin domain-containing protein [Rhizobium sp. AG207R]TWB12024.1 ChrR-like anti-ECFsigma factor [Rhizobium sp. ERR1071]
MTNKHHPSDQTLLRFAAGTLPAGPSLVVAAHLSGCPFCQRRVVTFEAVGGEMLIRTEPQALSPGALEQTLARLDQDGNPSHIAPRRSRASVDGIILPSPLAGCEVGPWRPVGPGVRLSRIRVPHAPEANVILLKVKANKHMPAHGHTDLEVTQVLKGSFSDGNNRYEPGDFVEGDDETDHSPVIGSDGECISLAAIEGHVRFKGFFGRLLAPFAGI